MASSAFRVTLAHHLDVLFVYIGWARRYDGTEAVNGSFRWLKSNVGTEADCFVRKADGMFHCGIGSGALSQRAIHVVFVARDPSDHVRKAVGVFASAQTYQPSTDPWLRAKTSHAFLFEPAKRPVVPEWSGSMGVRRWASRGRGVTYPALLTVFQNIRSKINRNGFQASLGDIVPLDPELDGFEGKERQYFIRHRRREQRLRVAKIRDAMSRNNGRLICEVPRCGFDFQAKYGDLGEGFVHVHHLKPLSTLEKAGEPVTLASLAVVCANCHAMIHLGGANRGMSSLIPK